MAADLSVLDPSFKAKVSKLVIACKRRGCEMRPNIGRRDPVEQARLWRQSRSREEIQSKIAELNNAGAKFLAKCIDKAGPQSGAHVTNALPGFSWHQWDVALDCFWVVDGKAEWSTRKLVDGLNGYQVYADEAEKLGLTAGGHWATFKDWAHVQLNAAASPAKEMSLQEIDGAMKSRFG
jgi:hypothetical protein